MTHSIANVRRFNARCKVRSDSSVGSSGQVLNPTQKYCGNLGHKYDATSGLTYMRARYYEAETGRFISEDPAMHEGNRYAYCGNNPIDRCDSTGKFALCVVSLLIALLEGIISASIDIGIRMASNGGSWSNINWGQVAVSAAVGIAGGVVGHFFRAAFYSSNALKYAAWIGEARGSFSTYFMKFIEAGTSTSLRQGTWTAVVRSMILGGGAGIFMQMYGGFLQSHMDEE